MSEALVGTEVAARGALLRLFDAMMGNSSGVQSPIQMTPLRAQLSIVMKVALPRWKGRFLKPAHTPNVSKRGSPPLPKYKLQYRVLGKDAVIQDADELRFASASRKKKGHASANPEIQYQV